MSTDFASEREVASQENAMIKIEKRKMRGVLTIAGLMLGGGGVFYLACARDASARAVSPPEAIAAQQTIIRFLDDGGADIKTMETTLHSTDALVKQLRADPKLTQVPLSELKTNPFRSSQASSTSASSEAAEQGRREAERLAMLHGVEKLQLQSILSSDDRRACMINNGLYREGQAIDRFTIERITESAVIIRAAEYRFELKIHQ